MDRKSLIMVIAMIIATIVSIYFLYQRSYVTKDFNIVDEGNTSLEVTNP